MTDRIVQSIENAFVNNKKTKILCRNSYERKIAHTYANAKGISHKTILDYSQIHINQTIQKTKESYCCSDCDGYEIKVTATPYSFVQVNNGYVTELIGTLSMIPKELTQGTYGSSVGTTIEYLKEKMKTQHSEILKFIETNEDV
jgi:phosphoenolpyruvate synthase/pyruvate phosphate dikinase